MLKQHNEFDCLNSGECESPANEFTTAEQEKFLYAFENPRPTVFNNLTKNNRFIRLNSVNLMNVQTWFFVGYQSKVFMINTNF